MSSGNRSHLAGVLVMAASSVLFAVMSALIKYGKTLSLDPSVMVMYRFAICLALMGSLAMFGRIRLDFHKGWLLFGRGFIGGIAVVIFYLSIYYVGMAKGSTINYSYPIFATIGGAIFLGEKVPIRSWVAVVACFVGIGLIAMSGVSEGGGAPPGSLAAPAGVEAPAPAPAPAPAADEAEGSDGAGGAEKAQKEPGFVWYLVAILGAVLAGAAVVTVKKLRETDSSYAIYYAQCAMGFWIVAVPASLNHAEISYWGGTVLIMIGLVAAAAQLTMTWAFRHTTVATGSLLGMLAPVFNIPVGLLVFGEQVSGSAVAGIAIVLASCALVVTTAGRAAAHGTAPGEPAGPPAPPGPPDPPDPPAPAG